MTDNTIQRNQPETDEARTTYRRRVPLLITAAGFLLLGLAVVNTVRYTQIDMGWITPLWTLLFNLVVIIAVTAYGWKALRRPHAVGPSVFFLALTVMNFASSAWLLMTPPYAFTQIWVPQMVERHVTQMFVADDGLNMKGKPYRDLVLLHEAGLLHGTAGLVRVHMAGRQEPKMALYYLDAAMRDSSRTHPMRSCWAATVIPEVLSTVDHDQIDPNKRLELSDQAAAFAQRQCGTGYFAEKNSLKRRWAEYSALVRGTHWMFEMNEEYAAFATLVHEVNAEQEAKHKQLEGAL